MKKVGTEDQSWLVSHVEKLVLGGAGVLLTVFVYVGSQQQGLTTDPSSLQRDLRATQAHIDARTWELARLARDWELKSIEHDLERIDFRDYPDPTTLNPPLIGPPRRRIDPHLYPPIELEAHAGSGPVAHRKVDQVGPLKHLSAKDRQRERWNQLGFQLDKEGKPIPVGKPKGGEKPPEQIDLSSRAIPGHRPARDAELRGTRFVAVLALVPHLQQLEEYEATFGSALGYEPARDVPNYRGYEVLRAESDHAESQQDWESVATKRFTSPMLQAAAASWSVVVEDPLPDEHFEPHFTGNPISLTMRYARAFWLHPRIEALRSSESSGLPPLREERNPAHERARDLDDPLMPAGRAPLWPVGQALPPAGLAGAQNAPPRPTKFYLLRFYDTSVEPGKFYSYRVRLWFSDPNDPPPQSVAGAAHAQIQTKWLDEAVVQRLNREAAERKQAQATGAKTQKRHWRMSPWSEATNPVALPTELHVLAGAVSQLSEMDRQRHLELAASVLQLNLSGIWLAMWRRSSPWAAARSSISRRPAGDLIRAASQCMSMRIVSFSRSEWSSICAEESRCLPGEDRPKPSLRAKCSCLTTRGVWWCGANWRISTKSISTKLPPSRRSLSTKLASRENSSSVGNRCESVVQQSERPAPVSRPS